ncbi:hypothetical protein NLJ89_g1298 [Agrocybe chaxingu]|uniref:glucan 1,3-beta-glucosidase n=1 Tax=Agrocybe chaxingu TaxID=84603 RepID=A0A9W8N0C6_9AGAR|nr:hypothetical protein NLJ89_g1298 [Agrocybe chaxingu]
MTDSPASSALSPPLLANKEGIASSESQTDALVIQRPPWQRAWYTRKRVLALLGLVALVIVFLAVFLPVFFIVIRKKGGSEVRAGAGSTIGGGSGSGVPNPASPSGATSGGDGSVIRLANGTEFTYRNSFGGFWVQDPADPFNNNARPNLWTPPLNTSWTWGKDRIHGVNLGGLFVLEPFITPDIFQRYPGAVDEYTLSQAMAADTANGGLSQLEQHYDTFITEQDIAEIAGAGLNFLRIPIAFWAIETWEGEPYLAKTSWKYFLRVLEWARKYGLRVCLDLHAVPGSQNGYNHSGRMSPVNFLAGNMGLANAERTLYYIRVFTQFISQPQYRDLIPIFGIVNEALVGIIGQDSITSFYLRTHDVIRNITGLGEGHGPYIAIHDGFQSLSVWDNFLQGSDRIILDEHPYFAFGGVNTDPIAADGDTGIAGIFAIGNFGVTFGGEFSASPNDCGLFMVGVGQVSSNPQCPEYDSWETFNTTMKEGIQNFVKASFDALGDWFFWTWKLGLRNGWIPQDPRSAVGMCQSLGAGTEPWDGTFQPWQTGTPSSIPEASSSQFPWPPVTISSASVPASLLPTYTNTAPVITLPPATFTAAPSSVTASADGWFNHQDTEGGITTVAGCPYPNEYDGIFSVVPTAACTGPESVATPTPPPV